MARNSLKKTKRNRQKSNNAKSRRKKITSNNSNRLTVRRPANSFARFLRHMRTDYRGDIKEFSRTCSEKWRAMDESEKFPFQQESRKEWEEYTKLRGYPSKTSPFLNFMKEQREDVIRQHPDWNSNNIKKELTRRYKQARVAGLM